MNKHEKITLVGIKNQLARLPPFKNRCYVCHAQSSKHGMTFHHKRYEKDEKTYGDFTNTLEYYQYLQTKIRKNPRRFLYLCNPHHLALERIKRYNIVTLKRLLMAVRMSR